jgi:hypothetical protein
LSNKEAADAMAAYETAHQRTAAKLFSIMGVSHDGTDAGRTRTFPSSSARESMK